MRSWRAGARRAVARSVTWWRSTPTARTGPASSRARSDWPRTAARGGCEGVGGGVPPVRVDLPAARVSPWRVRTVRRLAMTPKKRSCKDCQRTDLKLPHPGPRCHRCNLARRKVTKTSTRDTRLARLFAVPRGFYEALKRFQGGSCYFCRRAKGISKQLAMDHDHKCCDEPPICGKCLRGLLCSRCNVWLGYVGDDPDVGRRVTEYLTDPPARRLMIQMGLLDDVG